MNHNRINTILLSNYEVNHLICSDKKGNFTIEGGSFFSINPFDKLSLDNALKEIGHIAKNDRLTKLNIINDNVLKYQFILNQNEASNLRVEVLNRFKTAFDIPLNEYYIDFETYSFKNMIVVFIAGINRRFLDTVLRNFKSRKFKLLFLEVDIVSLKRLISLNFSNEIIMNIHLREEKTIFIVIYNDMLLAFREVNFGFKNIVNTLFENTETEPSTILDNLDFEEPNITEAFDKLTIELRRTIDFYNSQFRNEPVRKLILTGKFLKINGIDKFLSGIFTIQTEKFNGLKKFFVNTEVNTVEQMTYLQEILGTSLREI